MNEYCYKYIYVTGPDGSGKTTYLLFLKEYLKEKGFNVEHVWIRSPKILSKPLMAYCRLVGLTKYFNMGGIRYGGHEFYRSRFVSLLFPHLQYFDFLIKQSILRKRLYNSKIVLFDRFALDTLADLMVDTHRFDLHKGSIGRAFLRFISPDTKILVLRANEQMIRERKKDAQHDPQLSVKLKVYDILARDLKLTVIDNNGSVDKVRQEVLREILI